MTDTHARPLIVAIDGLSGAGKSTVARTVACRLGLGYLDTGATYRGVTLAVLRAAVDLTAVSALADIAGVAGDVVTRDRLGLSTDPADRHVRLDGVDVTAAIRTDEVTTHVSAVSAVPAVRRLLVDYQRTLVQTTTGCVVEGRDVGTVIFPDAPVKVWLAAEPEVRARRRAGQRPAPVRHHAAGAGAVQHDQQRRDAYDAGRSTGPARPAPDAAVLDSTALNVEEVVAAVLGLVADAGIPVTAG